MLKEKSKKLIRGLPRANAPETQTRSIWGRVSYVRGQSMFEVLFAVVIASLILIGVVSLAAASVRNAAFSRNKALANKYSQEVVEWLRAERNRLGWGNETSGFRGQVRQSDDWCLVDLSWSDDYPCSASDYITSTIFIRSLTWTNNVDDVLEFNIVVSWDDGNGHHDMKTTTVLTNWL